jgi:hypothetical protein
MGFKALCILSYDDKALQCAVCILQGLEREYDRLLSEHDALQKKLSRMGGQPYSAADKKSA